MEILYKSNSIFYEYDILQDFIDTLASLGGIGRFRGNGNVNWIIEGEQDINLFKCEQFQGQWDFEPTLIIKDNGEYGSCFLTVYEGNDDLAFIEYVYRWKGSLFRECASINLWRNFKNKTSNLEGKYDRNIKK